MTVIQACGLNGITGAVSYVLRQDRHDQHHAYMAGPKHALLTAKQCRTLAAMLSAQADQLDAHDHTPTPVAGTTPGHQAIEVPVSTTHRYATDETSVLIRPDKQKPRTHLFVAAPKVMALTIDQAHTLADALHDQAEALALN